jgi:predicted amidohydrolase YtcJ
MVKGSEDKTKDWYFFNGFIWNARSRRYDRGEFLIRDGRIDEIAFRDRITPSSRSNAERIDLEGGFLTPGFIDSHMHLLQWAITMKGLNLGGAESKEDIIRSIRSVLEGRIENPIFKEYGIIFGIDYDDSRFTNGTLNNGGFLEDQFPDTPIMIRRVCGHKALANDEGMGMTGIDPAQYPDHVILEEDAMRAPWVLPLGNDVLSRFISDAIQHLFSMGVVGGVDILPSSQLHRMVNSHNNIDIKPFLTISLIRDDDSRIDAGVVPTSWDDGSDIETNKIKGPRPIFEKFFLDGSIGSRTASFFDRYLDADMAPLIMDDDIFERKLETSIDDGLIPMVHCIGDRAISQGIRVMKDKDILYRLEHAEAITDPNLDNIAHDKGALSIQPNFQHTWGRGKGLYEMSLGGRYIEFNPFRKIANSKVQWCFGTDMMPPDPLYGIKGAMAHPDKSQRLTREEAVMGFTEYSKRLSFIPNTYDCQMSEGSEANIIIISSDFNRINFTIFRGRNVYLHHSLEHMY